MFDSVKVSTGSRSTFDLSHHQVTTTDFGYLTPVCVREMLPNDDFTFHPRVFCRLAPTAKPFYGRIKCRLHHFFVPNRILWKYWDSFITDSTVGLSLSVPYFTFGAIQTALQKDPQINGGSSTAQYPRSVFCRLMSNLGLNPDIMSGAGSSAFSNTDRLQALNFLAYYKIWIDYFMDSSLNDHASLSLAFDFMTSYSNLDQHVEDLLRYRNVCFKKDYFTTAKIAPQKGNPAKVGVDIAAANLNPGLTPGSSASNIRLNPDGTVFSNASSSLTPNPVIGQFTIEELRAVNAMQRYLERQNFVGSKVINQLLVRFGASPSAERLDMAEFIDGSSFDVQIGDVTSTTPDFSGAAVGLGAQAGKGIAAHGGDSVRYHAKEHGVFMSLLSVLPDTDYYQGIHRSWTRGVFGDNLDFFNPEFENLGYQEILNKELYVPLDPAADYTHYDPEGIFGYSPRYSDYKWQPAVLAGDFVGNTNASSVQGSPLGSWHLFRELNYDDQNPIALNNNFVECDNHNNSYDRVFQITNPFLDHFYFNIDFDVKATRDMSGFTEPTLDATNTGTGHSVNIPYGGTRL